MLIVPMLKLQGYKVRFKIMINKPKKCPNSQNASKIRGKYKIEDLVAKLPSNYEVKELDWGKPLGLEVW